MAGSSDELSTPSSPPPLPFGSYGRRASGIPPLTEIALETLAANSEGLICLGGIAEHHCAVLLWKILQRGRLDYRLACLFRDAGHAEIREAIPALDLLSGMPTHNSLSCRNKHL